MKLHLYLLFIWLVGGVAAAQTTTTTLIASGAVWRYSDKGRTLIPPNQGNLTWKDIGYDDSSPTYWSAGASELGYGDEATVVSFGGDAANKFITTYFRKKITIPNVGTNVAYELRFMRDDGIIIYVNGNELPRDVNGNTNNMPAGPATYTTHATASVDAPTWSAWQPVSSAFLQNGDNSIAVEIHQVGPTSSDITFNLEMRAVGTALITRGPYLQLGTRTGATIRWRTDVPTIGRVTYGLAATNLNTSVSESASTTEHEIRLDGLTPDRQYFYSVGTTTQILQQGPDNYFLTAPPGDTKRKIRIATFGDCGNNFVANNQTRVRDGFLTFRGSTPTDLLLLTGDNSYDGDDNQYQTNFFQAYQTTSLLKNSMIYPVPGNHDYNNNLTLAANHNIAYYSIFNLPTNAEAGGLASGTEEWYSFDYGPAHLIMLDGYGTRNVGGMDIPFYSDTTNHPQAIWLKQDLMATTKKWKIVYLHFPAYTQGSHNSETEPDLVAIRQRINPILERFGVDLIMLGHSHVYERSYPIHDHTGPLSQFATNPAAYRYPQHNSSGRYDGSASSCPYVTKSEKKKQGTVYVVSGSAGALGTAISGLGNHPAMVHTEKFTGGSFFYEIEDNRLDAKFLQNQGTSSYTITDQFTMMKDVGPTQSLTVATGQSLTLSASFISDYQWSNTADPGFSSSARSVTITATTSATYVVRDSKNCVQDVYAVQVFTPGSMFTVKAGNWNDPTVWSGNRIPTITDALQLKHAVLIPAGFNARALRLTVDSGIELAYGANATLRLAP